MQQYWESGVQFLGRRRVGARMVDACQIGRTDLPPNKESSASGESERGAGFRAASASAADEFGRSFQKSWHYDCGVGVTDSGRRHG